MHLHKGKVDGQVVKLFFRDATELFHVSGIDHVYEEVPMDGSRFIQEIKDKNIDLTTVKNVNTAAYKDFDEFILSEYKINVASEG